MTTSKKWIEHFTGNLMQQRIDWNLKPSITPQQVSVIIHSLQAWQLGETSEGHHLIRASTIYAKKIADADYVDAVKLFIKEEQKHGNNLGLYIDLIGQPRVKKDWGDTLFRKVRYLNTSMEIWTLAVITVESTAQIFYQALKCATGCTLLQQICSDILTDEAYHIDFQTERLAMIFDSKSFAGKVLMRNVYTLFFFCTSLVVWFAHKKLFQAGGINFKKYLKKMKFKYMKKINKATCIQIKTNGVFQLISKMI
ncbi:MAG: ferritin-like domain-containing protein [Parafilimonas sp.]